MARRGDVASFSANKHKGPVATEILINERLRRLDFPVSPALLAAESDLRLLPVHLQLNSLSGERVQGIRKKYSTFLVVKDLLTGILTKNKFPHFPKTKVCWEFFCLPLITSPCWSPSLPPLPWLQWIKGLFLVTHSWYYMCICTHILCKGEKSMSVHTKQTPV